MAYVIIPYIPDGPVTRAIKKKLKRSNLSYKLGYLGELMDENYTAAIKYNHLLYEAEHLKKLKDVEKNPEVVAVAFAVLGEMLQEAGVEMPAFNESRPPYYPDYWAIAKYTLLNAFLMTVAITAIVLALQSSSIALMTTLIVLVSLLGTAAFLYTFSYSVIHVDISAT